MTVTQSINDKLVRAFAPVELSVINESDMHSGPPGRESHFKVVVVADAFEGLMLLKRHRAVNEALAEELAGAVHALSIEALTPAQWTERGGVIRESPPCLGGSKADKG